MSFFRSEYLLDYRKGYYIKYNKKAKKVNIQDIKNKKEYDQDIDIRGIISDNLYKVNEDEVLMTSVDMNNPLDDDTEISDLHTHHIPDIQYIDDNGGLAYSQSDNNCVLTDIDEYGASRTILDTYGSIKDYNRKDGKTLFRTSYGMNIHNGQIDHHIDAATEERVHFVDGVFCGIDKSNILLLSDKNELYFIKDGDFEDEKKIKKIDIPKEIGDVKRLSFIHNLSNHDSPIMLENYDDNLMHVNIDNDGNVTFGGTVYKNEFTFVKLYRDKDSRTFDIGKRFRKNNIYVKDDVDLNKMKMEILSKENINHITIEC